MKYLKLRNYPDIIIRVNAIKSTNHHIANRNSDFPTIVKEKCYLKTHPNSETSKELGRAFYEECVLSTELKKVVFSLQAKNICVDVSVEEDVDEIYCKATFIGVHETYPVEIFEKVSKILDENDIGDISDTFTEIEKIDEGDGVKCVPFFRLLGEDKDYKESYMKTFKWYGRSHEFDLEDFRNFFAKIHPQTFNEKDEVETIVNTFTIDDDDVIHMKVTSKSSQEYEVMSDILETMNLYERYIWLQNFIEDHATVFEEDSKSPVIMVIPNSDKDLEVLITGKPDFPDIYPSFKKFMNEINELNMCNPNFEETCVSCYLVSKDMLELMI